MIEAKPVAFKTKNMRLIKHSDHGLAIMFFFGESGPHPGIISVCDGSTFICSNVVQGDICSQRFGYLYSYNSAGEFPNSRSGIHGITFTEPAQILVKHGSNGILFRRIYKKDYPMIYLGTIQKDIEDCKKPSPVITIMDMDYLKEIGWKEYENEPSAEEKVQRSTRASGKTVPRLNT